VVVIVCLWRSPAPSINLLNFPVRYERRQKTYFFLFHKTSWVEESIAFIALTKAWFYVKHIIFPVNGTIHTATSTCILKSTILEITCKIAVLIRLDPPEPRTISG